MSAKQADHACNKHENEELIGTEQVCDCEIGEEEKPHSDFNHYECTMLNDLELCNVQTKSTDIEKWFCPQFKNGLC